MMDKHTRCLNLFAESVLLPSLRAKANHVPKLKNYT